MADLDDFFAKRDKKKKTKKFTSSEELAKQLENSIKEKEAKAKAARQNTNPTIPEENPDGTNVVEKDEEWKEFEEEKKDYSGLKLGQLTITQEEQNQQNMGQELDSESAQDDDDPSENPWKASGQEPVVEVAPVVVAPVKTGVYVPPSVQRSELATKTKLRKGVAPDLKSEDYFPSLGTERVEPKPILNTGFEEVKHGGKYKSADSNTAPVSQSNRFMSLGTGELDS
ncbi:unnamed protein product [Diamesa hyperborea]